MADFVPSNIIQTPDFGKMAQNYLQQYRQEEAAKNQFIDSFEKKQGLYLEGDKPAVQEAWNNVQAVMDMVAENDTPEMRRKLREAYGEYGQLAGAAQAVASQYRDQVSAYKADPTKFAITGQEFLNSSEDYRLQRRNASDIFSAIDNPYTIQRSIKYDLMNPYDQAKSLVSDSRMKLGDFYDDQGQLNKSALRAYAEKRARAQVNALPENVEKAMAWGGIREGYAGQDGVISAPEELEFIRSQDDETRARFVDAYVKELTNNYVDLVASELRGSGSQKDKKKLGEFTDVIVAADVDPSGSEKTGTEISGNFLSLPSKLGDITAIGLGSDGNIYIAEEKTERIEKDVVTEEGLETKKIDETSRFIRRAKADEVSKIVSKYGNTYDLSLLSGNSVSSQSSESQDFNLDEYYEEKGI